jgi:hypothetical protein
MISSMCCACKRLRQQHVRPAIAVEQAGRWTQVHALLFRVQIVSHHAFLVNVLVYGCQNYSTAL